MQNGFSPCSIRVSSLAKVRLSCVLYVSWFPPARTSPPIARYRRKRMAKSCIPASILLPCYSGPTAVLLKSYCRSTPILPGKTPRIQSKTANSKTRRKKSVQNNNVCSSGRHCKMPHAKARRRKDCREKTETWTTKKCARRSDCALTPAPPPKARGSSAQTEPSRFCHHFAVNSLPRVAHWRDDYSRPRIKLPKSVPFRAKSCHACSFAAEIAGSHGASKVSNCVKAVQNSVKPVPKVSLLALPAAS
jgi:hypothetical protein